MKDRSGFLTHLWWQIPLLSLVYAVPGIASLFEVPWEVAPGYYFYPPSGIGIGILWIFGHRLWPAIFLGAVTVTTISSGAPVHALATGIGNTLEALLAVFLLRKSFDPRFTGVKDVRIFVVAVALGATVSGILGTTGIALSETRTVSGLLSVLWMWSIGHFMGGLLMGSAIVAVYAIRKSYGPELKEGLVLLAFLLFVSYTAFASVPGTDGSYPLQYLAYPVLIWAALRLAPAWVMAANLTLAGTMLFWTSLGVGPIHQGSPSLNLAYGATFSLVAWLTSTVLAAIVAERASSVAERVEREDNYRAVVEQALEGIFVLDQDGVCQDVNGAGCRLLERSAELVIGRPFIEFVPRETREEIGRVLEEAVQGDGPQLVEWAYADRGEPLWVEASIKQIDASRTQVFARNITRRKSLERQVAEAQKMEAVGLLAGGVAHDFNNLLTVVLGQAGRARAFLAEGDQAAECIDEVVAAARKSSDLTKQLLTFARRHAGHPSILDVNQVIEDRTAVIRQLLGERIRYVLTQERTDHGKLWVLIDPVEFEQVVLNLVINAKDAMENGGELTISTRVTSTPEMGEAVLISVRDVGHGMSPKTAKRIFEPFFTTKGHRNRTGLGLAVSYGIIRNVGGTISFTSAPDQGTEFTLLLPRSAAPVKSQSTEAVPSGTHQGNGERILVIEDEDPVRELITLGLAEAGYRVLGAPDGESALQAHADAEEPIQLVVSDVILPGRSGPETVRAIQSNEPEVRAVFISGYDDDEVENAGFTPELLLRKPFTIAQLRVAVRNALDGERLERAPTRKRALGSS